MTTLQNERLAALEGSAAATARSLVRRSDIKVVSTGVDAYWDWKQRELHVPAYTLRSDDDPALVNAWRGMLDHECAHVVLSDMEIGDAYRDEWTREFGQSAGRVSKVWNAIEDRRIEPKWGALRPGSARYLDEMNQFVILKETGGAGPCHADYPVPVRDSSGLARGTAPIGLFGAFVQSLTRVGSGYVKLEECGQEVQDLWALCRDEIDRGLSADTVSEGLEAAGAIWRKLADTAAEPPPEPPPDGEGEGEGGESEDESDGGGADQDEDGDEGDNDSDGEDGAEGDADGDADEGEGAADGEGDNDGEGDADGEPEPAKPPPPPPKMTLEGGGRGDGNLQPPTPSPRDGGERAEDGEGEDESEGEDEGDNEAPPPRVQTRKGGGSGGAGAGGGWGGLAAEAVEGAYNDAPTVAQIIAGKVLSDPTRRPYTVHPDALRADTVETYDSVQRMEGRKILYALKDAAGPTVSILGSLMEAVILSTKQTLVVGGLEEGEFLDDNAMATIALGLPNPAVYASLFKQQDVSTYVCVLVDSSGSMGQNAPFKVCPVHGKSESKTGECQKRDRNQKRCGQTLRWQVDTKSGQASVMAMALHEALRGSGVPHAILGHTCYTRTGMSGCDSEYIDGVSMSWHPEHNPLVNGKWPTWSRYKARLTLSEYVPSPGLNDDGSALPYITGRGANLDGEAVQRAAIYAAEHAGDADRIILVVIADGLPAGADDGVIEDAHLQRTVRSVADAGIEVYGIGVGVKPERFQEFYPNVAAAGGRAAIGSVCLPATGAAIGREVLLELTDRIGRSVGFSRGAA